MRERSKNLDVLRVLAAFMVVMLHVSAPYVMRNMENPNSYFTIGNFFDSMSRISVPIFVMISGTFLLDNSKNLDYKWFYKKTFKNIIIPTFLWSLVYVIYNISLQGVRAKMGCSIRNINYFIPILNWAKGKPFYHLWYMYMILGLYFVTPMLIRIKNDLGDKKTLRLGWALTLVGVLIGARIKLIWPIQFISYLGYFILGYSLKKYYMGRNKSSVIYILGAILSAMITFSSTQIVVLRGVLMKDKLYFYGYLAPFVVIGSICTFIAFLNMKEIKLFKWTDKVRNHSFNIYIIHAGILDIVNIINRRASRTPNPIWYIPLMSIMLFILSYIVSLVITSIANFRIVNKAKHEEKQIEV